MKRIFLATAIFFLQMMVFGQGDKDLLNKTTEYLEEYEPKVIIHEKFGKGKDEFGIYELPPELKSKNLDEIGLRGPSAMDIDKEGNIYIFDAVNWRVKKYNKEGKLKEIIQLSKEPPELQEFNGFSGGYPGPGFGFGSWTETEDIRISDNNIFICAENPGTHFPYEYFIRKYTLQGNLISLIFPDAIKKEVADTLEREGIKYECYECEDPRFISMKLCLPDDYIPIEGCDVSHPWVMLSYFKRPSKVKVYMDYKRGFDEDFFTIGKFPGVEGGKVPEKVKESYKILAKSEVLLLFYLEDKERLEKVINFPPEIWTSVGIIEDTDGKVYQILEEGEPGFGVIVEDTNGNIYVQTGDGLQRREIVLKYDFKGELVAKILLFDSLVKRVFVSWNGDVYQIVWNGNLEEGVKIIRWERKR
jgi:hypothetical protein